MRTVYPIGTTLYKPDKCFNGYTILWHGRHVKLIDMNGRTAHEWHADEEKTEAGISRAKLLPNGNILVARGGMMSEDGLIQEYGWGNNLVWEYIPEGGIPHARLTGPHHDVTRVGNGNTLMICREAVPESYMHKVHDPRYGNMTLYGDAILEVSPAGEVVWEWHGYEHLDLNQHQIPASPDWFAGPYNNTACDWMHVNTVRPLPENRWHDAGDERFKPGNVMISPRSLDTVYIIARDTKEVAWEYSGDYRGGLSGQHEPYMIPKGMPGAGNVLIFDNGASPWRDLAHCSCSYVLEVNPVTKEVVWKYEARSNFHSRFTSSAQRLPNGNTLICEAMAKRVFEVTSEGEIVWEYVEGTSRSYRYPYDHCPQTVALGVPREVSVTPPAELRVPPDAALN